MFFMKTIVSFLKDRQYLKLLFITFSIIGIGTGAFMHLEGWSLIDALYFCVVTITTIGYGDLAPVTDSGKLFNIVYIIVGLGIILNFIETVHEHYENMEQKSLT